MQLRDFDMELAVSTPRLVALTRCTATHARVSAALRAEAEVVSVLTRDSAWDAIRAASGRRVASRF